MTKYCPTWDFLLVLAVVHSALSPLATAQQPLPPVPVFVLAGQSNMLGQAVIDLDHPQYYNGGKGTLNALLTDPAHMQQTGHLRDASGSWTVRDDVWIRYQTPGALNYNVNKIQPKIRAAWVVEPRKSSVPPGRDGGKAPVLPAF